MGTDYVVGRRLLRPAAAVLAMTGRGQDDRVEFGGAAGGARSGTCNGPIHGKIPVCDVFPSPLYWCICWRAPR